MRRSTSLFLNNPELQAEFTSMGIATVGDLLSIRYGSLIRSPVVLRHWNEVSDIIVNYWKTNYATFVKS